MTDDRHQIPGDSEYFHAVGLAMIAFARLEWNALWCLERFELNYIGKKRKRPLTAGIIAKDLTALFQRVSDNNIRSKIEPFAAEFADVVNERNALIHGKPGTSPGGEQRLFRDGTAWTIAAVNEFSDRCVRAEAPFNALLYNEFREPCTVTLNR